MTLAVHRRRRRRLLPAPLSSRPLVSVVIPCFNYADYVLDAAASVLSQPDVDVEVIIVDDCSTDRSVAKVRSLVQRDPRVRLIEHAENRGPVQTFNDGLELVTGDHIVRLDADDLLTPGSLRRSCALLEKVPTAGMVYGHPLHFTDTLPTPREAARKWTVWDGQDWLYQRCRTGVNVITSPEVVMRRSVVDEVGGQRDLAHTHDMEMWLRIASVSDVGYIQGSDQAWHREHDRSLSQSLDPEFGDIRDRLDAFTVLFDWCDQKRPAIAHLRQVAKRALADEALRRIVHLYDRGKAGGELEQDLWRFFEELDSDVTLRSPRGQRAERLRRLGADRRPSMTQFARAASTRIRNEAEYARWHRTGVFQRDRR